MDAFLLVAAVSEARPYLIGAEIQEVRAAGAHGLWLALGPADMGDSLLVTADPAFPRLCRGTARPPRPAALSPLAAVARRVLPGRRLQALVQRGLERTVALEFAGAPELRLVAELFGRRPNLLLLDAGGAVLEAAQHATTGGRLEIGRLYTPPAPPARPDPSVLSEAEIAATLPPLLAATSSPAAALRLAFTGLTDLWAEEIARRAASPDVADLARSLATLLHRAVAGPWEPHVVLDAFGHAVAAVPFSVSRSQRQEACPTLADAAERVSRARADEAQKADRRSALRRVLRRLDGRLRSRKVKLAGEATEFARADLYQRMGSALVRSQDRVPRGAAEVVLPDPTAESAEPLRIPLDPTLSPSANAEGLFRAARRGRRGLLRVEARLAETEADLARVGAWTAELDRAPDAEWAALQAEVEKSRLLKAADRAELGKAPPAGPRRSAAPGPPRRKAAVPAGLEPRRFRSADGIPILVGRGPESNDYLTLHLARSDDLWLHVHGRSGSHVVVRAAGRPGGLPRRSLIQAAQLAAYYSQARNDGKVEVAYTLKKYVRKPKKAKPGLVAVSQEKTIIVSPDKALLTRLADADSEK